jgi:uncharacterized protein YegP (UPF0339 family)
MSDTNLKFVIFRDLEDGYKWRLRSAAGETIAISQWGHPHKDACEQEVQRLRDDKYPGADVLDLTVRRSEN